MSLQCEPQSSSSLFTAENKNSAYPSMQYVMEREEFDDNRKTVLSAAVAACTLSLSTKCSMKEGVNFIKHVISTDWIQAHGLKHLFVSLYNVGVILYRHKQVKLMLPWENLPILRNQEVCRMPSVGSINATLDQSYHHLNAYYILNPSGDLCSAQEKFENWFRDQNHEGKSTTPPTAQELSVALKSHDLFIYFSHGSGSPLIVANLWEVTDKDIDRFGKAVLDALLKERSIFSMGCAVCKSVSNEFESMDIGGNNRNCKKKTLRKKLARASDVCMQNGLCSHRPKIGSSMAQATEACTLPFLIGAAPVCYGVPTDNKKKGEFVALIFSFLFFGYNSLNIVNIEIH